MTQVSSFYQIKAVDKKLFKTSCDILKQCKVKMVVDVIFNGWEANIFALQTLQCCCWKVSQEIKEVKMDKVQLRRSQSVATQGGRS